MKKFFALALICALVLALVPSVALAETYTDWTSSTSLPTAAGAYKLTTDVTLSSKVDISNSVKLDLNGKTVTLNGAGQFFVRNTGSLTIEDSVGSGKILISASSTQSYAIQINGGNFQVDGGTIENTKKAVKAVFLNTNSTFTQNGGAIINNVTDTNPPFDGGCPVHVNSGATFILNGGEVVNLYTKGGNAIYLNSSGSQPTTVFTLNGGTVKNAAAGSDGLVSAIEGSGGNINILITAGEIVAPGTGIEAPSASVEITGGKITAVDGFAIQGNNATIGGTAQITAGNAVLYAKNNSSNSNTITGGTFVAPELMESTYASADTSKVTVSGGTFTDPSGEVMLGVEGNLAAGAVLNDNGQVTPPAPATPTPTPTPAPATPTPVVPTAPADVPETGDHDLPILCAVLALLALVGMGLVKRVNDRI